MKSLIFVIMVFCVQAFAVTEYVNGTGSYSGSCRRDASGPACSSQIENAAKHEARRKAEAFCRMKNGNLAYYSGYCSSHCSPPTYGNDGLIVLVTCRAECRYACEIP